MTPSGIEPATFRFVAQHLNHCATAVQGLRSTQPQTEMGKKEFISLGVKCGRRVELTALPNVKVRTEPQHSFPPSESPWLARETFTFI